MEHRQILASIYSSRKQRTVRIPTIPWLSQGLFFQHPIYPGERTHSFHVKRKAKEDDGLSSSHHLILSEEIPMKKNPVMITHFLKKVHCDSNWKRNQDAVYWVK